MGFLDMFYPERSKKSVVAHSCAESSYPVQCQKHRHYGEYWRKVTPAPVCGCCDCMAQSGYSSRHHHYHHSPTPTYTVKCNHTHEHKLEKAKRPKKPKTVCFTEPPSKYSLLPQTTHKTAHDCAPHVHATPINACSTCVAGTKTIHHDGITIHFIPDH